MDVIKIPSGWLKRVTSGIELGENRAKVVEWAEGSIVPAWILLNYIDTNYYYLVYNTKNTLIGLVALLDLDSETQIALVMESKHRKKNHRLQVVNAMTKFAMDQGITDFQIRVPSA